MRNLKIENQQITLVDQVEEKLLAYIREQNLCTGNSIPSEQVLAETLGVARSVLREALSRLKMIGMIETRTRKGMMLKEPFIFEGMKRAVNPRIMGEELMFDILGFRVALEMGICDDIFYNITPKDLQELEEIVRMGGALRNNEYGLMSEYLFHSKLYRITGNKTITQFQELIHPIITFIKDNFQSLFQPINMRLQREGRIVTHSDLLDYLKKNDAEGYRKALENHFMVYKIFLRERKERMRDGQDTQGKVRLG